MNRNWGFLQCRHRHLWLSLRLSLVWLQWLHWQLHWTLLQWQLQRLDPRLHFCLDLWIRLRLCLLLQQWLHLPWGL